MIYLIYEREPCIHITGDLIFLAKTAQQETVTYHVLENLRWFFYNLQDFKQKY